MDIVGRTAARSAARRPVPQTIAPAGPAHASAEDGVTALYHAHALGLIRLAHIMLGDRTAAEDVVQDAFCGLYRHWSRLADQAKALPYVRSSVLNGCRSALRRRRPVARLTGGPGGGGAEPAALIAAAMASAEAAVLSAERRREVMTALRALPDRQREVLVLRFYLDLPDTDIARDMGISPSTVRSTAYRALAALGRSLGDSK
jgi:RNA polymerase sigma-70 factor (sigma-E family)